MTYYSSIEGMGAATAPSDAWRKPIVEAAQRYLVAVANARRKMPGWGDADHVYRVAGEWLVAAGRETLDQLRFRAAFWAPISPTSMPVTRYNAQAEEDAVLKGQADLKALLAPPAVAPTPAPTPPASILWSPTTLSPAPATKAPIIAAPAPELGPVPEAQCADGYVRDAAGLCVAAMSAPQVVTEVLPAPVPMVNPSDIVTGPQPVAIPPVMPSGPLGVSTKWWLLGTAGLVGVGLIAMSSRSKAVAPNSRRRHLKRR